MPDPKPAAPEPQLDLAEHVRLIAAGVQRLLASGLNKRAVMVLLKHETGLGVRDIEKVLDGLGELARQYTTKPAERRT